MEITTDKKIEALQGTVFAIAMACGIRPNKLIKYITDMDGIDEYVKDMNKLMTEETLKLIDKNKKLKDIMNKLKELDNE